MIPQTVLSNTPVSKAILSTDKKSVFILGTDNKLNIQKYDGTTWNSQPVGQSLASLTISNFALSGDQKTLAVSDTNKNLYAGNFDSVSKIATNDL